MNQRQQQNQKQLQKQGYFLSQQHLKLMHLMHLSGFALQEYIANEVEQNPALEMENENPEDETEKEVDDVFDSELFTNDDGFIEKNHNQASTEDYYEAPVIHYSSLQDKLKEQLHQMQLPGNITDITCYFVDELDEDGYLRRSLADVSFDYGFTQGKLYDEKEFEEALGLLQKCDPPGIAARDLRECLLLQLYRKTGPEGKNIFSSTAITILESYYDLFVQGAFDKLRIKLAITEEDFKKALTIIHHLNPKPVTESNKYELMRQQIMPEFEVSFDEDEMYVSLAQNDAVRLKINADLNSSLLRVHSEVEKKQAEKYYANLVDEAQSLINALHERGVTMMKVISCIASVQKDFFKTGDMKDLKPMILHNIADATGYDVSTVSRITSNKHVQTPHGIYPLKNLFMRNINPDVELNSQNTAIGIQDEIKKLIADEDKKNPLSDSEIVKLLQDSGITIARRTVVKYREAIGIQNSTMRKQKL